MNHKVLLAAMMALCLIANSHGEIVFKEGAQYQTTVENQPFRVYQDLGDGDPSPDSIREGYLLLNNEISATVQYDWPSYDRVSFKLTINSGQATWSIGTGSSMSITSVPYLGTSSDNAIYFNVFAQASMTPSSPTRGIILDITSANGQNIGGHLQGTFNYPNSGAGDNGILYGFQGQDMSHLTIDGTVTMVRSEGSNPYSFAFQIGTGHTDLEVIPTPEPGTVGLLIAGCSLTFFRRRRK